MSDLAAERTLCQSKDSESYAEENAIWWTFWKNHYACREARKTSEEDPAVSTAETWTAHTVAATKETETWLRPRFTCFCAPDKIQGFGEWTKESWMSFLAHIHTKKSEWWILVHYHCQDCEWNVLIQYKNRLIFVKSQKDPAMIWKELF